MKANVLTPRDLFDGRVTYEIPPFQRPYVWTEEDQWQPLWDDVVRVAEDVRARTVSGQQSESPPHFLGAVVVKQMASVSGDPRRSSVIDGQQRLTTLQLLLDAAQYVMEREGSNDLAESLQELVLNTANAFKGTPKRFKLWPSRVDRDAFEQAMDNAISVERKFEGRAIVQAHRFFVLSINDWLHAESEVHGVVEDRLAALAEVLMQHLLVVVIDLADTDDDQIIFETLNDRGTPLLAADLIKNHVFQRCDALGVNVDIWGERYWQDFDGDWWRGQIAQGRQLRSRIDLFLQYWLTMRVKEEIPTDGIFASFRRHARVHLETRDSASTFLDELRRDATVFREFAELDPDSAQGSFYTRVVEALELGVFIPLLLWVIADAHRASPAEADRALRAVESWAVRRTLLRRTMKDVNRLVVALLRDLEKRPVDTVGAATVAYLEAQDSDARLWPTDQDLVDELPRIKVYGNIKQRRLRAVLSGIELQLRTRRHENVTLPSKLSIEHVMPRGWRTYWQDGLLGDPEACADRDQLVNTVGNLTLATKSLNSTLSNRPWSDEAVAKGRSTGDDKGLGKRALLNKYSVLALSRPIVDEHPDKWTNDDIIERSRKMASVIAEAWPRG